MRQDTRQDQENQRVDESQEDAQFSDVEFFPTPDGIEILKRGTSGEAE